MRRQLLRYICVAKAPLNLSKYKLTSSLPLPLYGKKYEKTR